MLNTFKLIGLSLLVMLLAACGAEDAPSQALSTGAQSPTEAVGSVIIQKGPVANATVMVKSYEGQDVGKATTNADGQYKVDSSQPGLFIAEARDSAGKAYYSVGLSANMNINHLSDYLLRQWFQARGQDVESAFASGASASSLPNVQELNVLANQIVAIPAYAMQKQPTELFGGEMTATLAKILKGATIESDTQLRINLPEINFNGIYTLKAPQLKKDAVVFEGTEETSSENVPTIKGPIAASVSSANPAGRISTNSRLLRAAGNPMVGAASGGSNEHWMKDNWDYIKDKKLVEIVIPGTHDSGTYNIGADGAGSARSQTKSIGDQLKDGIRYFDLRAVEAKHGGDCAAPSAWWIAHGGFPGLDDPSNWTGGWIFYSYRVSTALDEIKAFLDKPGNENEMVILDLQDTKDRYNDARAKNVLIGLFQDKLGSKIVKNLNWKDYSIETLVKVNKRAVVLLEDGIYNRIEKEFKGGEIAGCYGKTIDYNNFSNRTVDMISLYDEDHAADAESIGKYTVDAQLNLYSALVNRNANRFFNYRQAGDGVRVLQLVARPPNTWYLQIGSNLLDYASWFVNVPLNYHDREKNCPGGWLGKRLRMGLEGNQDKWNPPNVVIADNYEYDGMYKNKGYQWVLPDYKDGKWVKGFSGSYVDMIIELNKIRRGKNRLSNVTDMQDGQCLQ